ncbi:MAG: hypothetical protein RIN56_03155 [Sporomusaceae bacterium]|nr:hypothetical protein [Sporomusaceae bacterium]
MKVKVVIIFLAVFLTCSMALCNPIVKSLVQKHSWTETILVYSDSKIDVYIPADMINTNLFWTNYPQTGNFSVAMYFELKDDQLRRDMIESIKKGMAGDHIYTMGKAYPDLFRFAVNLAFFDMQNKRVTISREMYIDQDGELIGLRDTSEATELNEQHPLFTKLAQVIAGVLDNAKNSPKNVDRLKELQR